MSDPATRRQQRRLSTSPPPPDYCPEPEEEAHHLPPPFDPSREHLSFMDRVRLNRTIPENVEARKGAIKVWIARVSVAAASPTGRKRELVNLWAKGMMQELEQRELRDRVLEWPGNYERIASGLAEVLEGLQGDESPAEIGRIRDVVFADLQLFRETVKNGHLVSEHSTMIDVFIETLEDRLEPEDSHDRRLEGRLEPILNCIKGFIEHRAGHPSLSPQINWHAPVSSAYNLAEELLPNRVEQFVMARIGHRQAKMSRIKTFGAAPDGGLLF
ncbi:hypothetical protein JCM10212_003215 [Sporobolomyces blumeae]